MPIQYSNPFTAAAAGLRESLLRREEQQRREEADQLARDRETRLKAHDEANLSRLKVEAASADENRKSLADERHTRIAQTIASTMAPGVIDASSADALRRGHMGAAVTGDTTLPAQTIALPAAGLDQAPEQEAAAPMIDAQDMEALSTGEQTFLGDAEQQEAATQMAVFQRLIDDPKTPKDVKLAAQFAMGGKSVPTELIKPEEREVTVRSDAQRRVVERLNEQTGAWEPFRGLAPGEKAKWLQEPTPSASINLSTFDPSSIQVYADLIKQGVINPTVNRGNAPLMDAALSLIAKEGAGGDIGNARAGYQADQAALTQINKSLSSITAFENTAQRNIKLMQDAMKKITDTGIPILNRPLRTVQGMTGSPDVARFNAAVRVVIPEIARILTQPNLTGQLTDTARHEMEAVVRGDATVEQMNAVVDLLVQDMEGRKVDLTAQKKAIEGAIRDRGPSGTPAVVAPAAETPEARGARLLNELIGQGN